MLHAPTDASVGWVPRGISFSAGGVHIVGHMGVLARLIELGAMSHVRDWYGCSGGSICAFFGALGVSATWIREAVEHFDTSAISSIEDALVGDYLNCWGVNSGEKLIEFGGRFVDTWEPGSSAWTFADFARNRPGVSLSITATNVTRGGLTVFNAVNTPSMRILHAIRASSAVPCLFTPWKDADGDMYSDGAILEYFPWQCVRSRADTLVIISSDTGISGRKVMPVTIHSFGDYISRLIKLVQQFQTKDTPKNWIAINNRSVTSLDFYISKEQRLALFAEGVAAAEGWLSFRRQRSTDSSGETAGNHLQSAGPYTSSSDHCAQDRTSDIHQSQSPPRPPCPFRDSRTEEKRYSRRWSL